MINYKVKKIDNALVEVLNKLCDGLIQKKQQEGYPYEFIEQILLKYLEKYNNYYQINGIEKIKPIKKWEIMALALNFFESIDSELSKKIKDIVFGNNPKTKFSIYKISEIDSFDERDIEFKMLKRYSKTPINRIYGNKNIAQLPLQFNNNKKEDEILGRDTGTVNDAYVVVHELAHTFDIYLDFILDSKDRIISRDNGRQNNILTESTAIGFERALASYMLEKGIIDSEMDIKKQRLFRENDTQNQCMQSYAYFEFSKIKEKKGVITEENIKEFAKKNKLNSQEIVSLVELLVKNGETGFLTALGYAISGMLSPTIQKLIEDGETEKLKEYIEKSRIGDFEGALSSIGISQDENGIKIMEKNREEKMYGFEKRTEQEEQR